MRGGPRQPSAGRAAGWTRRRLLSVGVVVLLMAGAVVTRGGDPERIVGGLSRAVLGDHPEGDGLDRDDQADRLGVGDARTGIGSRSVLRGVGPGHRRRRDGGPEGHGRPDAGDNRSDLTPVQVNAANQTLSSDQARLSTDESNGASTSQIYSDQAAVTSAESQLTTAKQNLADASLTSHDRRYRRLGQPDPRPAGVGCGVEQQLQPPAARAGERSAPPGRERRRPLVIVVLFGSAQIVVVSTDSYKVTATVDDTQVGQIKVGRPGHHPARAGRRPRSTGPCRRSAWWHHPAARDRAWRRSRSTIAVTGTPSGLYAGTSVDRRRSPPSSSTTSSRCPRRRSPTRTARPP